MKITVANTFVIEFPGIPEPEEKPRFKTIEDFETQESFNEYIIEITKPILFTEYTAEEKVKRANRWSRSNNWEAKFYDAKDNCVFRYKLSTAEYTYKQKDYRYYKLTEEQQEAKNQEELKNIPMDIFLSICGFSRAVVSYEEYRTEYLYYNACSYYSVIIAWLLGISKYRQFSSDTCFTENYVRVFKTLENQNIIENEANKALEKYHEIYGVGKSWRTN